MDTKRILKLFKVHEFFGICVAIILPSIAYAISRYAGSSARDYAGILGPTTGLFGVIYGAFWFWPNYLQQKRIDNVLVTTKEALGGLLDVEENIKKLIFVLQSEPAKSVIDAHFAVSYSLTRLKNAVLLLKRDEDLIQNNMIEKALMHIATLDQLLNSKTNITSCADAELIQKHDVMNNIYPIAHMIDKLKLDLLRIYDMN